MSRDLMEIVIFWCGVAHFGLCLGSLFIPRALNWKKRLLLTDRTEYTENTRKMHGRLDEGSIHDPDQAYFILHLVDVKVDQNTNPFIAQFEIGQQLLLEYIVERVNRLYFYQYLVIDNQVDPKTQVELDVLVNDRKPHLRFYTKSF